MHVTQIHDVFSNNGFALVMYDTQAVMKHHYEKCILATSVL